MTRRATNGHFNRLRPSQAHEAGFYRSDQVVQSPLQADLEAGKTKE